MSRTQGRNDSDIGYTDGKLFVAVNLGMFTTVGTGAGAASSAVGVVGVTSGSTQSVVDIPLSQLIYRTGEQDWLQERFGAASLAGAQGLPVPGQFQYTTASLAVGAVSIPVFNSGNFTVGNILTVDTVASSKQEFPTITSIIDSTHIGVTPLTQTHSSGILVTQNEFTTPAGVTGPPPFTSNNSLTPVTAPRPKGVSFKSIAPVWIPGATAPTGNAITMTKTVWGNAAAPVVTTILASTNLSLATGTTALTQNVPLTPAYQTSLLAEYIIRWTITGATATLYGIYVTLDFNYN
jgi:hypothetical protein